MVQLPILHVHYYFELLHIKNDIRNVTDIMRYKSALPLWPTNKAWAIVWVPSGIIAAPIMPQTVPASHPTTPSVSYIDIKNNGKIPWIHVAMSDLEG